MIYLNIDVILRVIDVLPQLVREDDDFKIYDKRKIPHNQKVSYTKYQIRTESNYRGHTSEV